MTKRKTIPESEFVLQPVKIYKTFFTPETSNEFDFSQYDYVVDAIDSVTGKIELVLKAQKVNTPIISCLGTGNKIHPEMFEITDIYKTSVCPLAKVMRTELKKRGVKKLKVLYSKETPIKQEGQRIPASISFTPPVAGLIIAGEVVRELMGSISPHPSPPPIKGGNNKRA